MNILITGGFGFIGTNALLRFMERGYQITIFDNLNKFGMFKYVEGILSNINFIKGDLRNKNDVEHMFIKNHFDAILHLGAQTAVTTSVINPTVDFETNAIGTFNVLEAVRKYCPHTKLIYSSTNKIYGALKRRKLVEEDTKYTFKDPIIGITEDEPLDFFSPYGCSKGAASQYVRDYARIYRLNTAIAIQSCIYGKHQDGTENQGWVAWFVKAFLHKYPITIYGDGKQVRDILYIDDLIDFYECLLKTDINGDIYNIGGGLNNSLSILELIKLLEKKLNKKVDLTFSDERPGDQKIFISDNTKAEKLGWKPKVDINRGLDKLIAYLKENGGIS